MTFSLPNFNFSLTLTCLNNLNFDLIYSGYLLPDFIANTGIVHPSKVYRIYRIYR